MVRAGARRSIGTGALLDVIRRQTDSRNRNRDLPVATPLTQRAADTTVAVRSPAAPTPDVLAHTGDPTDRGADEGPTERPAERLANEFMAELSRTVRSRPAALPAPFRPLADSIAGPRRVLLATDDNSRRALRKVGKVAATTGDTIHLDRSAVPASKLDEVMAHELTHIAAPSPAPRFFDDLDDSPEERRADRVGRLMARSPLAPSSSVMAPPGSAPAVRRSPTSTASAGESGSLSADALAGHRRDRGSSPGSNVIRRWATASPSGQGRGAGPAIGGHRAPPPSPESNAMPAVAAPPSPSVQHVQNSYSLADDERGPEWFADQLEAHMPQLLRMIEDRMIVELERRGGRTWRMT